MRRLGWIVLLFAAGLMVLAVLPALAGIRATLIPNRTLHSGPIPTIVQAKPAVLRPLANPPPPLTITATTFANSQDGWISGSYPQGKRRLGFVQATTDGGKAWHRVFRQKGQVFDSLVFANARDGWALNTTTGTLYRTVDGGSNWTQSAHFDGLAGNLILGRDDTAWLVVTRRGAGSEVVGVKPGEVHDVWNARGQVLSLALAGRTLTAEVTPSSPHTFRVFLYAQSIRPRSWIRVGMIGQYPMSLANAVQTGRAPSLWGELAWTSTHTGVASVFAPTSCANGCGIAEALITHDGGRTWHELSAVNIACQYGPTIASRGAAVAVEESVQTSTCGWPATTFFVSGNGGTTFSKPAGWPETGAGEIGFASPAILWGATNSAVMMSFDKGQVWRQVFPSPIPTGSLSYASRQVLYAAGDQTAPGAVLRSDDQGKRWHIVTALNGLQVSSLDFTSIRDGWAVGQPLDSADQQNTVLLHTTDGGVHWHVALRPPPGTSYSPIVRFFSAKDGELLNLGGACSEFCHYFGAVTHDRGAQWTRESARRVPSGLEDGAILAPKTALGAVGTFPGRAIRIYQTQDNGQTWHVLFTVPGVWNDGLSFSFPTARVGYLGATAQEMPSHRGGPVPLPHFALLTTVDGGHHWFLHLFPKLTKTTFFSLSIYFGNAQDGMLRCDDNWWRTTDGGHIWTEILSSLQAPYGA